MGERILNEIVARIEFFTATTERFAILVKKLSENNTKFYVPKILSETRWSCHADAKKAIVHDYEKMIEALADIYLMTKNRKTSSKSRPPDF